MPLFFDPGISDEQYRAEQLAFVSDQSGSSYSLLMCGFLLSACMNYTHHLLNVRFPWLHRSPVVHFLSDVCITVPTIMVIMLCPPVVVPLCGLFIAFLAALCWLTPQDTLPTSFPTVSTGFVEYRSVINLWTLVAILAVDFHVFPRFHTKSEFFGLSLMDVGVGAFVITSGIAAGFKPSTLSYVASLKAAVVQSFPLFALGLVRLLVTGAAHYQHHVSEYGVHLNFFFTLGLVQLLVALLHVPRRWAMAASIAMMFVNELVLHGLGLYEYARVAPRDTSFFAANREGLLSVVGYAALHMFFTTIGYWFSRSTEKAYRVRVDAFFAVLSAVLYVAYRLLNAVVPPCRSLLNATYFAAVSSMLLGSFALIDVLPMFLPLESTVGSNGLSLNQLPIFLLSNVMTGVVNLLFYTLYVPTVPSLVIIFVYTAINRAVAFVCGYFHVAIKIQSLSVVRLSKDNRTTVQTYSLLTALRRLFK